MKFLIGPRILLVSFFIFSNAIAREDSAEIFRKITQEARKANIEGRYRDSIKILKESFSTEKRRLNSPALVLLLQSDNYEKIGEYELAIRYLIYYMNREFKAMHRGIMERYVDGRRFNINNVPERLAKAYERKAMLYSKLYLKKVKGNLNADNHEFFKKVELYNELCLKFPKNDCTKSEKLVSQAQKFKADSLKKTYFLGSAYTLSYYYFQDDLKLENQNTLARHDIAGLTHATCAGITYGYQNDSYEFNFQPCFYVGQSALTEADPVSSAASYSETAIVYGSIVALGLYGKFFGDKFPVGFSVAMRYRSGSYPDKEASDVFKIIDGNNIGYGGFLEGKYNYSKDISFVSKIGVLDDVDTYIYSLQLNYIRF